MRLLLACCVVLLLACPAWAATPTFVNASDAAKTTNATSKTINHTAGATTNGLAVVCLNTQDASIVHDGVTYDGNAMTQIGSTSDNNFVATSMWYYKSPPAAAVNVIADFGADNMNSITMTVAIFQNVNQTAPIGTPPTPVENFDTVAPSEAQITVTGATDELFVSCGTFVSSTNTPGTGDTSIDTDLDSGNHNHGMAYKAGAASTTMNFTDAGGFSNTIQAVQLKPSADRRPVAPIIFGWLWNLLTPYEAHAY